MTRSKLSARAPCNHSVRSALLALVTLACSGRQSVETTFQQAGANGLSAAGSTANAGSAGEVGTGSSVQDDGGGRPGGEGAASGASAAGNADAGAAGTAACQADADCVALQEPCAAHACLNGACHVMPLALGTPVPSVAAAACHASVCDGQGQVTERLDPRNVPQENPCWSGACDAQGKASSEAAAAGTPCTVDGGQLCDGAGQCVACLSADDCASGLSCVGQACVGSQCTDGARDGNETDVDCGGSCPRCAVGRACAIDQDCSSDACEPVSKLCLMPGCIDQQLDGDETDVDCGGSCSPCLPSLKCQVDSDCSTRKCDQALLRCGGNECLDGRQNGRETDVDCGGANICSRCRAGQHCKLNSDCSVGISCDSTGACRKL